MKQAMDVGTLVETIEKSDVTVISGQTSAAEQERCTKDICGVIEHLFLRLRGKDGVPRFNPSNTRPMRPQVVNVRQVRTSLHRDYVVVLHCEHGGAACSPGLLIRGRIGRAVT